ncbi:Geranylgeranyl transferase type-2 subunit beta/prenyltransferase alpha-alpha toroid [Cryptosporidium tyzzeri]|nr:Geranylgeranyl transferase type-2 subunit beta/prenyltransferase alpha-alpha toroid [Cryptosporidium tyzzeri]
MYNAARKFDLELHKKYLIFVTNDVINSYDSSKNQLSSVFIHGIYWVLCCSDLIQFNICDQLHNARNKFLHLLKKCERELLIDNFKLKFYSLNPFDFVRPSILSILSGIQIKTILNNKITEDNKYELTAFIKSLIALRGEKIYINNSKNCLRQLDVRFIYSTLLVYYLSNYSDLKQDSVFRISELTKLLVNMQNKDGGFGKRYKDESHAGYTFCAVSSIAIIKEITKNNSIDLLFNFNRLNRWLLKRIIASESHENTKYQSYCFNGRIGKKCDVCYSWWVFASLKIVKNIIINRNMDCSSIINSKISKILINGILCHQNNIYGGFQKSPFNTDNKGHSDPLHTFLSISALSLIFNSDSKKSSLEFYEPTEPFEVFEPLIKIDPISVISEKYLNKTI